MKNRLLFLAGFGLAVVSAFVLWQMKAQMQSRTGEDLKPSQNATEQTPAFTESSRQSGFDQLIEKAAAASGGGNESANGHDRTSVRG